MLDFGGHFAFHQVSSNPDLILHQRLLLFLLSPADGLVFHLEAACRDCQCQRVLTLVIFVELDWSRMMIAILLL